jgi:hypothetical protein
MRRDESAPFPDAASIDGPLVHARASGRRER